MPTSSRRASRPAATSAARPLAGAGARRPGRGRRADPGAGGVGTAGDVAAVLAHGADGVRIGTRFLAAAEADVHPEYLARLVAARAEDTVLTETFSVGWPDAPHRVLAYAKEAALAPGPDPVARMTLGDGTVVDMRRRSTSPPTTGTTGDIAAMALYAGMGVGSVTGERPAAEILAELCEGLQRLTGAGGDHRGEPGPRTGTGSPTRRWVTRCWPAAVGRPRRSSLRAVTPHVLPLDLGSSRRSSRSRLIGEAPVDVLVNNGGVDARNFGVPDGERDVLQLSGEHFMDEMRINALGPLLLDPRRARTDAASPPAPHRERVVAGRVDGDRRQHRGETSATRRRRRR